MKTERYKFEQMLHKAANQNNEWLKEEFKSILEADKDFTRKTDYIGYAILSLDQTMQSIDQQIRELQQLKKLFLVSKEIALTVGAEVLLEYGIDRLDGAGISSITVTKPSMNQKSSLIVENAQALIEAGFYKKVLYKEQIQECYNHPKYQSVIQAHTRLEIETVSKPAKLHINKRRSMNQNDEYRKEIA